MVTRTILIKEDMTVELGVYNYPAKYRVLDKVSSIVELQIAMIKIVSLNICTRSWKGLCKNGFYLPKSFSSSQKCKDCQVITKREKLKQQRITKRLIINSKKTKNNYRKVKERLIRSMKKIENMQGHIDDLIEKCSALNENALNKNIKNLSKQQREVLRTTFNSSKVKDKQEMRYYSFKYSFKHQKSQGISSYSYSWICPYIY
ncbi:uncharacterized protein LOC127287110 [Leptopilina boulardi]|uniref:uncharacterized protein LOC127287110 n=1 Tax=Leptopilina boulardi TaxID=63433 RepID=UPI0021F59E46|nr:uncharacterized protein LOC127287110 [Leptopilina boulardi]